MLLSAGGFARYRAETHVFNTLAPRFGGMTRPSDMAAALDVWLQSDCHTLTGLAADDVREAVRREGLGAGALLRAVMGRMSERQNVPRWAETTPAHVLHMREIAEQVPGALFIHVIRDGRDVAASLEKQGWIRPFAADRHRPVIAAAAFWDWIVRHGRAEGRRVAAAYLEVRYEALVDSPASVLAQVSQFIEQRLDADEITRAGIGSVGRPNTSFPEAKGGFRSRWKSQLAAGDGRDIDAMLAPLLRVLGYPTDAEPSVSMALRRFAYAARFSVRDAVKRNTPAGRRATSLAHFAPGSMTVSEEKLEGTGSVGKGA